ncbi:MAG: endopeptidase La [Desulfuromonadales bacterium]|nr:endopeptidase La [Desulfuromonadales bacterium]
MTDTFQDSLTEQEAPETFAVLPLRDIVIFPYMVTPLFVGRPMSIRALEWSAENGRMIFLVTQRDPKTDEPEAADLYEMGTLGKIVQMLKLPDGTVKVLVEGRTRARIEQLDSHDDCVFARLQPFVDTDQDSAEQAALIRSVKTAFESYANLSKKIPPEMISSIGSIDEAGRFADAVVAHINVQIADKQSILEDISPRTRLEKLLALLEREVEILQIEKKIRTRVKSQMERSQKEYYLNEQMRAIQKELGEKDEFKQELRELEEKISKVRMSKEATDKATAELRKLKMMSPMSAEATVVRNYIDWLVSLPWRKGSRERIDLERAEQVLETDHYGLDKVKERILEYLAVQALVKKIKGPILCLVGPPGVGKTSLGRSIASATGRKFIRVSLGGVRDEAEIRGHRRTYIGAMPGKIIQGLRKGGSRNPVFLLDEVDKMSTDFRGDPSSALLEVLDPEQNHTFGDHFLDVDYDLSSVMFIATANNLAAIPGPLRDRMEVIRIEGYTEEEKVSIAERYLVPKQLTTHGLHAERIAFSQGALLEILRLYTREAGVRNLEREIATICRKIARKVAVEGQPKRRMQIGAPQIRSYLGVPRYSYGKKDDEQTIGLVNGLAWTEFGGELLTVEATTVPGSGKITITGKLGEVMRESAQAALSYVRSRWLQLGLEQDFHCKIDIHIHVPEGAVPKDGPSAGITMATALVSALTGRPVDADVAMTGEVTLRGRVLTIGGLKEKLLAARRAGIRKVLIPAENEKNLEEVPANVRRSLEIIPVRHMDQVLDEAIAGGMPLEVDAGKEEYPARAEKTVRH